MMIRGRLERSEGVINVVAEHLDRLALPGASDPRQPRLPLSDRHDCPMTLPDGRRTVAAARATWSQLDGRAAVRRSIVVPADATTIVRPPRLPRLDVRLATRHRRPRRRPSRRRPRLPRLRPLRQAASTATTRCSPKRTARERVARQLRRRPGRDRRPRPRRHRRRRAAPPPPRRRAVVRRRRLRAHQRVDLHRPGRSCPTGSRRCSPFPTSRSPSRSAPSCCAPVWPPRSRLAVQRPDELDAIVALVEHNGGDLLLPRLIRYIEERRQQPAALDRPASSTPRCPMAAVWGQLDPIAVPRDGRPAGAATRSTPATASDIVRWPDERALAGRRTPRRGRRADPPLGRRGGGRAADTALRSVAAVFPPCFRP